MDRSSPVPLVVKASIQRMPSTSMLRERNTYCQMEAIPHAVNRKSVYINDFLVFVVSVSNLH